MIDVSVLLIKRSASDMIILVISNFDQTQRIKTLDVFRIVNQQISLRLDYLSIVILIKLNEKVFRSLEHN
jgi:hypothetical protein